jgi:thiosulfate reductase/polysulfide reductase chain A
MSDKTEIKTGACHFCPSRCGILLYIVDGRLKKVEGNPADPVSLGWTCAQGRGEARKRHKKESA